MKRLFNLSALCTMALLFFFTSCSSVNNSPATTDTTGSVQQINGMLDSFNVAAGKADFTGYFNFYTDDAIFTGTDATERWDKKSFMIWAKPIFDKGRAWNFTSLERHIYPDKTGSFASFDELLNTQMKICRGSGVVVKQGNEWKVQQYILSVTVPNDLLDGVIKIKTPIEDSIISKLSTGTNSTSQPTAQLNIDALKVSPGIFKVLMENEHVRVVQYSLKPGEKDSWHTHPPKSSYVVVGGKLKVYLKNGETILADEKEGTASWMDYVGEHYVENIGNTTVKIVYTEIK